MDLLTEIEKENQTNLKPKWVQPIHPIPTSMFKLSEAEKSELEDVLYSMSLESCGFLWNSKKQNSFASDYCPVVALEDKISETKGLFMSVLNNFNRQIYRYFLTLDIFTDQIYQYFSWLSILMDFLRK